MAFKVEVSSVPAVCDLCGKGFVIGWSKRMELEKVSVTVFPNIGKDKEDIFSKDYGSMIYVEHACIHCRETIRREVEMTMDELKKRLR